MRGALAREVGARSNQGRVRRYANAIRGQRAHWNRVTTSQHRVSCLLLAPSLPPFLPPSYLSICIFLSIHLSINLSIYTDITDGGVGGVLAREVGARLDQRAPVCRLLSTFGI